MGISRRRFLAGGLASAAYGLRTVLVEAGSDPSAGALAPRYENAGEFAYPLNANRVMALCGTSNHGSGCVNRMQPSGFRLPAEFDLAVE